MKIKNSKVQTVLLVLAIFVTFISLLNLVHADIISNPQESLKTLSITSPGKFDNSMCSKGQDFVVQISPLGCEPAVVRSDLLEQQDVQVYCPLAATQLNPLVNVNSISGISFSGKYPSEIRSIGFYPAQAALSTKGQQLNSPVLNNIGYVVIDLKQISNESALTNCKGFGVGNANLSVACFVNGTLTASLKYNANNIFGIGSVDYYLPQLPDSDWQNQYPQYSFWNGKGYLRVDNIQDGKATITVYDKNLNQASTVTLSQGQTSNQVSIPGFDLCSATMGIKLDGIENANTRAKLDINGNVVEVAKGEKFLNNQCQVRNIDKQGLVQDVQITCNTDSGSKTFNLRISPKVTIAINGVKSDYSLGDYLFTIPDGHAFESGKSVYLGYISSGGNDGIKDSYLDLAILANRKSKMTESELSTFSNLIKMLSYSEMIRNPILDAVANGAKTFAGLFNGAAQFARTGMEYAFVDYLKGVPRNGVYSDGKAQLGYSVNYTGLADSADSILTQDTSTIYKQATNDYGTVQKSFSSEKYPSGSDSTLGEDAMYRQIVLNYNLGQKYTVRSLCDEYKKDYPSPNYDIGKICDNSAALSSSDIASQYISVNGQAYQISLDSIYEPSFSDFGAIVNVKYPDGHSEDVPLSKNQVEYLNDSDYIQLSSLGDGTATLNVPAGIFGSGVLTLKQGVPTTLGQATGILKDKNIYTLTLTQVNLKQYAHVSLVPKVNNKGSQSSFNFSIGVEKRAIKLNPQATEDAIKKINSTISTLQDISGVTGKLVNASRTACQVTGLALTAINFVQSLSGSGIARTQVMTGAGGWNERCAQMVTAGKYSSVDQCFLDNADQIDKDVNETTFLMNQQNSQLGEIQKKYTTGGSLLSSSVTDNNKVVQNYSSSVQSSLDCMGSSNSIANPSNSNAKSISVSDAKNFLSYDSYLQNDYTLEQAKKVQLDSRIICSASSSASLKSAAQQELYNTLSNIQINSNNYIASRKSAAATGVNANQVGYVELNNNVKKYTYLGLTVKDLGIGEGSLGAKIVGSGRDLRGNQITINTPIFQTSTSAGYNYILILDNSIQSSVMPVTGVYDLKGNPVTDSAQLEPIIGKIEFQSAGTNSYQNPYKANQGSSVPEVQYFETDPYKGYPAIVPFDLNNGWYAAVKQTTSSSIGSSISSFDSSGRVESFWLCNVGLNGIEEFNSGIGDDDCQSINLASSSTYGQFPGITNANEVQRLVNTAVKAIQDAAKQYKAGVSSVVINGQSIKVGSPAANIPAIQCQDFMSPKECNALFNVCDPYVCPPSRCDFGGAFPVSDVIQTGLIGSTLLCLPNAREGIVVPVCLTGIHAGLDNLISVFNSTQECLQNQLSTGKPTGICNEVQSVYMCNLVWSELAPLANVAVPKIAESVIGQISNGGGEYSNFQSALNTAKQSESYITNLYAQSLPAAFSTGKTSGIGTAFCQNFVSAVFPDEAKLVDKLGTTDSPTQYYGKFDVIPYTTSTVPPQSQYNVYYHIYAGKNSGAYYRVYLKNSGSSYYQDTSSTHMVDSGYVAAGGTEDNTKDFTAPAGYTQLCINVNGQENCDFKQVSTSIASNYIQDSYVANQANQTDIKTSTECTSGTISAASILSSSNLNVQAGINDALHPSITSLGITRVCSTDNPGSGTDPYANAQGSRWIKVGYCDNQKVGCWLDTQSVNKAINSPDIVKYLQTGSTTTLQNSTLQGLNKVYQSILLDSGKYLTDSQFDSNVSSILSESDSKKQISAINAILDKAFYNNQKGELYLLRGNAYSKIAESLYVAASQAKCGGYANYNACYGTLESHGNPNPDSICSSCSDAPSSASSSGYGKAFDDCMAQFNSYPECSKYITSQAAGPAPMTAKTVLDAMTYAKSNAVGNAGQKCNCGTSEQCQNYANSIYSAATANGEDPLRLLAIMIRESGCNIDAANGNSVGLMQVDANSVSLCSSINGVSGISDVQGAANYDKNIQCGAMILKNKYDTYGSKQNKFPANSTGKTDCNGFSATYTGWDAALRGYNGYGCGGDDHYVENVNSIYDALKAHEAAAGTASESSAGGTSSGVSGGAAAFDNCMTQFNSYSECSKYLTASLAESSGVCIGPLYKECVSQNSQLGMGNTAAVEYCQQLYFGASTGYTGKQDCINQVSATLGQNGADTYCTKLYSGNSLTYTDKQDCIKQNGAIMGKNAATTYCNQLYSGSSTGYSNEQDCVNQQTVLQGASSAKNYCDTLYSSSSTTYADKQDCITQNTALMGSISATTYCDQLYPSSSSQTSVSSQASSTGYSSYQDCLSQKALSGRSSTALSDCRKIYSEASTGYSSYQDCLNSHSSDGAGYAQIACQELCFGISAPTSTSVTEAAPTFISPVFKYDDADLSTPDIYLGYTSDGWYWSQDSRKTWNPTSYAVSPVGVLNLGVKNSLTGKNYADGLKFLVGNVIDNPTTSSSSSTSSSISSLVSDAVRFWGSIYLKSSLSTDNVQMNSKGTLTMKYSSNKGSYIFYFNYDSNKGWEWMPGADQAYSGGWISSSNANGIYGEPQDMIMKLARDDFYSGVELIFNTGAGISGFADAISSAPSNPSGSGGAGSPVTSGTSSTVPITTLSMPSQSVINNYKNYASLFDKYSGANLPMGWTQTEFEALLAAVGEVESNLQGDYLMGYDSGNVNYKGADTQIKDASAVLKGAINGNGEADYASCVESSNLNDRLSCILSVYRTGKANTQGFLGIGRNTEGVNFAATVTTQWYLWQNYLNSQGS